MERVGLVIHGGRQDALAYAAKAAAFLHAAGIDVLAEDAFASRLNVAPFSQAKERPEVILSLGGDGTLLRGAQAAIRWDASLLGINLGRVGFLAEEEPDALEATLQCLLNGAFTLEERSLLDVRCGDGCWTALNDVVVSRGGYARLITLNVQVDGEEAGRYVADGMIVATPTGSTGYSLSAGGPIVSPTVDCMVITPICAHSLQHRPCVVPGGADVCLALGSDAEQCASLQVDGQSCASLISGGQVHIHRSEKHIQLIRVKPAGFFHLVRRKLAEWSS